LLLQLGRKPEAVGLLKQLLALGDDGHDSLYDWRDRVTWQEDTAAALTDLIRADLQQGESAAALMTWEHSLTAPCRSRTMLPTAASLLHEQGELVLTYVDDGDRLHLFLRGDGQISSSPLELAALQLGRLARVFARANADPLTPIGELNRLGGQLFEAILGPLASKLGSGGTLIFEISGDLARVPLNALPYRGGYLADRYRIVVRPVVGCLRQEPSGRTAHEAVLAVASPALDEKRHDAFPPLQDAREEAASIQRSFPATKLIEGREATVERIEASLPGSTIFHFAGHSSPRAAGIELIVAPGDSQSDGVWQAWRVNPKLLSSCRLAVFSACSTASPDASRDASPEDVVRAFLAAGVPEVVASQWNVDSAATVAFMGAFYSALAKGISTREAMQIAQKTVRNNPATAHPFYWAAFQLFSS
jgi:CHAT domain-containing protein